MLKRISSVLLALCLALTPLLPTALAEEADPLGRYDEPVTIRIMREKVNIWFPDGESIYDNVITRFIEEKLNIRFEIVWAVEDGQYGEQINNALAINDLPDIFEVNASQLYQAYRAEQIQPLQQVYDAYASQQVKDILSYNNNLFFAKSTFDGQTYGYPRTDDFAGGTPIMFIRQDWLDNLGLEAPTDMASFIQVCDAFTNGDPDRNGKNDTYALAMDSAGSYNLYCRAFAHMLGLTADAWLEGEDGRLYYTDILPETKQWLQLMQDFYAKGYISKEYISLGTDRMAYEISGGKTGIMMGYFWSALYQPQMNVIANPNAQWKAYPIPAYPDGSYHAQADNTCYSWLVCRKDFEHPEALIKLQNLWYEMWRGEYSDWFHGLNAGDYAQAQEDFKYYPPFWWDPPLKNYEIAVNLRKVYDSGSKDTSYIENDPEAMKAFSVMEDYLNGNKTNYYGWSHYTNNMYAWDVVEDYYGGTDPQRYVMSRAQAPMNTKIARRLPLVESLRTETFDKIIMGANIDTTFDDFVKRWENVGGKILDEEYNAWYTENKAVYWPE